MTDRGEQQGRATEKLELLQKYIALGEELGPLIDVEEVVGGARSSLDGCLESMRREVALLKEELEFHDRRPHHTAAPRRYAPKQHQAVAALQIKLYDKYIELGMNEAEAIDKSLDPHLSTFKKLDDLAAIYDLHPVTHHGFTSPLHGKWISARLEMIGVLAERVKKLQKYLRLGARLLEVMEANEIVKGSLHLVHIHVFFMKEAPPEYEEELRLLKEQSSRKCGELTYLLSEAANLKPAEVEILEACHDARLKKKPGKRRTLHSRTALYALFDDLAVIYDIDME